MPWQRQKFQHEENNGIKENNLASDLAAWDIPYRQPTRLTMYVRPSEKKNRQNAHDETNARFCESPGIFCSFSRRHLRQCMHDAGAFKWRKLFLFGYQILAKN